VYNTLAPEQLNCAFGNAGNRVAFGGRRAPGQTSEAI